MLELKPMRGYYTAFHRAGWALATGGGIGGALAALLAAIGGESPLSILLILLFGAALSALAIAALGGPVWIMFHRRGWRGPFAAASVGAVVGFVVFLAGQTYGFGLYDMPVTDTRTLTFRWLSGIATSAVMAFFTGGIGLAMWRVAYRRA